ncbi:MAG: universal stress protein [Planctomycetes bacterium]|nr:universal stress protein [Planctomycetota bacterium]
MSWLQKQKVVVPVDFSDESFTAVKAAMDFVDDPGNVLVVNVLQELSPMEPGEIWQTIDHESRIRHTMKALRERLNDGSHDDVSTEVVIGDPGREVVAIAEREKAELIVLTSHGRTGLKRLLIGSVAERVIRLAHCPVLVLRD